MSTKKSLAFLSKLAVAASASALILSATAADKYKWNNNAGDNRMANGDNWYFSGSDPKTYGLPTADDEVEFSHDTERYAALNKGETFNAKSLYVGRGWNSTSPAVVDVTNGTFAVEETVNLGQYGASGELNVFGGVVSMKQILVGHWGSHVHNKFNVSGGNVTVTGGSWPGAVSIGNQADDTLGVMAVSGGTVSIGSSLLVGFSNLKTPGADLCCKLLVSGGETSVSGGNVTVAEAASSGGLLSVSGGSLLTDGALNIASGSNSWGQVDVSGGNVTVGGKICIGNHNYAKHAVLTVGGTGVVTDNSSGNDYVCFGGPDSVLRLNVGGKLYFRSILRDHDANGIVEFNGGEMIRTAEQGAYGGAVGSTAIDEHHTVKILAGGMIFTSDFKSTYKGSIICPEGCGGITKRGNGELDLNTNSDRSFEFSGPIYVEGGTLKFSGNAQLPDFVDVIRVAEGATLVIPHDLTCRVLVNNGTIQGGTVSVEADAATKVATKAVWTGGMEDGNVFNAKNYIIYDQNGRVMYEQTITVDTPVVAPYTSGIPSFDGFVNVTWVIEDDVCSEGYSRPAVVNTAAAWYDPSDADTLTVADGKVTAIANKGTVGSALNLGLRSTSKGGATVVDTAFNGTSALYFDNASGYRSEGYFPDDFPANGPRSLFVVAQGKAVGFLSVAQTGSGEEGRSLLLAGDGQGEGYQVSYKDSGTGDWKSEKLSFKNYSSSKSFVFSGSTMPSEEADTNTVKSSIIDVDGNIGGTSKELYMPVDAAGLRFKAYYATFDVGFFSSDTKGYQGEALIFTNALSDAEMDEVNAYLKAKWLDTMQVMPDFDSLVVNAKVDLGGATRTFEKLSGSGSFVDGTVVLTGTLEVTVNPDGSVVAPEFDKLVLGENARLVVKGAKNLPQGELVTVLPFTTLEGMFASVVSDKGHVVLRYLEGHVDARRDAGFYIHVR